MWRTTACAGTTRDLGGMRHAFVRGCILSWINMLPWLDVFSLTSLSCRSTVHASTWKLWYLQAAHVLLSDSA